MTASIFPLSSAASVTAYVHERLSPEAVARVFDISSIGIRASALRTYTAGECLGGSQRHFKNSSGSFRISIGFNGRQSFEVVGIRD